jgi:hypothetical protein
MLYRGSLSRDRSGLNPQVAMPYPYAEGVAQHSPGLPRLSQRLPRADADRAGSLG